MTAKSFFKKVGRNIQAASGQLTRSIGSGMGGVLGTVL